MAYKVKECSEPITTPIQQITDCGKDVYYVYTFQHKELWVVVLLWFFALVAPLWTFLWVMFMKMDQFKKRYGDDLKGLKIWNQLWLKLIRSVQETFSIYRFKQFKT